MAISFGIHMGLQNISIDELRRLWRYADQHGSLVPSLRKGNPMTIENL